MLESDIDIRPWKRSPLGGGAFLRNDAVVIREGDFRGRFGAVVTVRGGGEDPVYVVQLSDGRLIHVPQSKLLPTWPQEGDDTVADLVEWYDSRSTLVKSQEPFVTVQTLEKGGWSVTINLVGTELDGVPFEMLPQANEPSNWVECRIADGRFEAQCGPLHLDTALRVFLRWARSRHDKP